MIFLLKSQLENIFLKNQIYGNLFGVLPKLCNLILLGIFKGNFLNLFSKYIHPKAIFYNPKKNMFGLIHSKLFHLNNYSMALNSITQMDNIGRR